MTRIQKIIALTLCVVVGSGLIWNDLVQGYLIVVACSILLMHQLLDPYIPKEEFSTSTLLYTAPILAFVASFVTDGVLSEFLLFIAFLTTGLFLVMLKKYVQEPK